MNYVKNYSYAAGNEFQISGEPNKDGNWFVTDDCGAKKRYDFVFEINGECFELTGAEMLEALPAFNANKATQVLPAGDAAEACQFPQSCTTMCDCKPDTAAGDDIPDFSPGNGNKARRRADALTAGRLVQRIQDQRAED